MLNSLKKTLSGHGWINSWDNGIYPFHHYHSNTHEVLVIYSGNCQAIIGGDNGKKILLEKGDVLIIPAGVSHKNEKSSSDFKCIGAYPFKINYNMKYGRPDEFPEVIEQINQVSLPKLDPVFGKKGPLLTFWDKQENSIID